MPRSTTGFGRGPDGVVNLKIHRSVEEPADSPGTQTRAYRARAKL